MAVIKNKGLTKMMWFYSAASTLLTTNTFVKLSSGYIVSCVSTDTQILGVYTGPTIAAAVATATFIPVEVPIEKAVEWLVDVEAGTINVVTSVGLAYDLNDAGGINQGSTTYKPFIVTAVLNTNKGSASLGQVLGVIVPFLS